MICWYCYWGWPKKVAEIYLKALDKLNGNDVPLLFGPSHIVWEDENFESAEWCLKHFDEHRGDCTDSELEIVKWSLIELSKLPLDERDITPSDYDMKNPELFPPTVEVVKI